MFASFDIAVNKRSACQRSRTRDEFAIAEHVHTEEFARSRVRIRVRVRVGVSIEFIDTNVLRALLDVSEEAGLAIVCANEATTCATRNDRVGVEVEHCRGHRVSCNVVIVNIVCTVVHAVHVFNAIRILIVSDI